MSLHSFHLRNKFTGFRCLCRIIFLFFSSKMSHPNNCALNSGRTARRLSVPHANGLSQYRQTTVSWHRISKANNGMHSILLFPRPRDCFLFLPEAFAGGKPQRVENSITQGPTSEVPNQNGRKKFTPRASFAGKIGKNAGSLYTAVESFIPSLKVAFPPSSWLALLPSPSTASPTIPPSASKYPFTISESLYTAFLDPRVPLSIAAVYAAAVHLLNSRCNGKPYYIATTRIFKAFVLLHNLFLAVYSLWTFIGMAGAIHRSIVTSRGVPGVVESLCKIRPETRFEGVEIREMEGGVGLWEEGLAFYGWLFYLSKFYEVLDTAIIIAKGKKSSLLQTYHHAGAMICMWAGIRFMSPPIWVFCIFNSLIHTLMYFYYTLSTVRIPVPNALKRSLTSLQITQFVVGGSLAALHLFVYFTPTTYLPGSVTEVVPSSSASASVSRHGMPVDVKAPGMVHCLSNPGEVWAVVANVVYLTPLTYLFVSFFVESYTKGGKTKRAAKTAAPTEKPAR